MVEVEVDGEYEIERGQSGQDVEEAIDVVNTKVVAGVHWCGQDRREGATYPPPLLGPPISELALN